jgi:hypothetical protein
MKAITFSTPFSDGSARESTGFPCGTPGLLIGRPPGECISAPRESESGECWTVFHFRTGAMVVRYCWASPEPAAVFAAKLGALVDWQQPDEALRDALRAVEWCVADLANSLGNRLHCGPSAAAYTIDNEVTR